GSFAASGNLTIGSGSAFTVAPTLVSRWSGEADANDATGRNNGTAGGGGTYESGDGSGHAVSLASGNTGGGGPDLKSLRSNTFTVYAWVNPSTYANNAVIIAKTNSSFTEGFALLESNNLNPGHVTFWVNISSNSVTSPATLPLNTWTFVQASYDGQ